MVQEEKNEIEGNRKRKRGQTTEGFIKKVVSLNEGGNIDGVPSLAWGRKFEPVARKLYERAMRSTRSDNLRVFSWGRGNMPTPRYSDT